MAQAIHCDWEGDAETPADVLVSQTADGSTSAWCFAHYVEVCRQVVATVEETIAEAAATAEADATAAEADRRLAGIEPATPERDPETGFPFAETGPDGQPGGEAGDQPVQESLGGPETGDPGQPAPEYGPAVEPEPGASTRAHG